MDRRGICIFGPFDVLFLIDFMSLVYFYIPPPKKKNIGKLKTRGFLMFSVGSTVPYRERPVACGMKCVKKEIKENE